MAKTAIHTLSYAQQRLLDKAALVWTDLPPGISMTNMTLAALVRRGLVESRSKPNGLGFLGLGEFRLKPGSAH